jgi:cytoskeletal protein CcmA (bactofilin family)
MFSALLNAQNRVSSTPITAVTWSIGGNTNSTYTGSAQSVTVVSVTPPGAIYSTSTTTATNAGSVASTTITGTSGFTGSFTSPNLTIIAATITGTAASPSTPYNAVSQTGTVITGVLPVGAIYSGSVTASGTNAGTYTSSITGTGNYTGTVNGGTFTISKVNLVFSNFDALICGGFDVLQSTITVSGFVGGQSGSLTIYTGTGITPGAVAGVSGSDGAGSNVNKVSQLTGANPIALGNVSGYTGMYLTKNVYPIVYFAQISGGANYNSAYATNPLQNDCGS